MEYEQEMREYRSADEKFTANRFDVTPIAVLPVVPKRNHSILIVQLVKMLFLIQIRIQSYVVEKDII